MKDPFRILRWLILGIVLLLLADFGLFLLEPTLVSVKDSIDARRGRSRPTPSLETLGLAAGDTLLSPAGEEGVFRFAVLGHLRPLVVPRNRSLLERLLQTVVAENPDLVFLLGDYTVDGNALQWGILDDALQGVQAPVYACPGNHEYAQSWAVSRETCFGRFQERFGPPQRLVRTPFANFLVTNSCDSIPALRTFLGTTFAALDPALPTILLVHHRIWMQPEPGRWFSAPFPPGEILPLLAGRVSMVLAGDDPLDPGKGQHAVSYHPATWEGIELRPVGIGDAGFAHPITYALGTIDEGGRVTVEVRHLPLAPGDSWYTVRGHDSVIAFQALSLPKKLSLFLWYLSRGKMPRGKVPLYGG